MCRLLAFSFNKNTDREEKISCLNSFKELAITGEVFATSLPGHADGWGIVVYKDTEELPCLYKSITSASEDNDFKAESFFREKQRESGLAHLRKKTIGEASLVNTHPFVEGRYSFIHNGTIAKSCELYTGLSSYCEGVTDSERIFRRFLEIKKSEAMTTIEAYTKMINETVDLYPTYSAINTILHDSERIYVSRVINKNKTNYEPSVFENYYTLYVGITGNNDIIVTSEKLPCRDIVYTLLPNESISIITLATGSVETHLLP